MDFRIPEPVEQLRDRVRAVVASEVRPLESDLSRRPFSKLEPALRTARDRVKAEGLWCPHVPAEYGGLGLGLLEFAFLSEELGRTPLGHFAFNCQAPDAGNMEILLHHGTDAQRARFLRPLAAGEIRSCFAMTEPERPGSNPTWLGATARREGDEYVIDGHKWFTSSADGAAFAIVMAVTNPDDPKPHGRASQLIVPTDAPGFSSTGNSTGNAGSR